ncbi:hypothetical protein NE236_15090 [Actinoallomurus purpureus]|uniref:hypothetical protein n=1 Tax=Actinoallomurus purpureus TaxID=478114 RepID=UPI0020923765|nr:hypothetical protein [Actinoallomurus purpureus]MCO6006315.1 hypothetical protein [Actinoallomurus purpureus]
MKDKISKAASAVGTGAVMTAAVTTGSLGVTVAAAAASAVAGHVAESREKAPANEPGTKTGEN